MAAPLRGTQSLVGQMGWVVGQRPLIAIEIAWRWIFGIPFLALCWIEADKVFAAVPADSAGLTALDAQNPWVAAVELARAWTLYRPHVLQAAAWVAPIAALAWIVISGVGRGLVLRRIDPAVRLRFRPGAMMMLQAGWLALLGATCWGWFACMEWLVATYISGGGEPDLVGFAMWAIFLSLGFFTLWALVSWPLSIAPLLMLLEDCSALSALGRSLRLSQCRLDGDRFCDFDRRKLDAALPDRAPRERRNGDGTRGRAVEKALDLPVPYHAVEQAGPAGGLARAQ